MISGRMDFAVADVQLLTSKGQTDPKPISCFALSLNPNKSILAMEMPGPEAAPPIVVQMCSLQTSTQGLPSQGLNPCAHAVSDVSLIFPCVCVPAGIVLNASCLTQEDWLITKPAKSTARMRSSPLWMLLVSWQQQDCRWWELVTVALNSS